MATIGRWNGYKFEITSKVIRGFTGLTIKGACETEDKKKKSAEYVKRKQGKPSEVSLTIVLNSAVGCNVRAEAMDLVNSATDGAKDYFYIGNHKLLACKLMLIEASVKEVSVGNGDTWIAAQVQLTMKQCDKGGSSTSGTHGKKKSAKKSKKKSNKKTTATNPDPNRRSEEMDVVDAVSGAAPTAAKVKAQQTVKNFVSAATAGIKKFVTAAKNLTSSKKSTTPVTNPSSASRRISGGTM